MEDNKNCGSHSCGCEGNVKCIEGVRCDVVNCIHHTKDNRCVAGKIDIGPSHADNVSQTACGTFRQNAEL